MLLVLPENDTSQPLHHSDAATSGLTDRDHVRRREGVSIISQPAASCKQHRHAVRGIGSEFSRSLQEAPSTIEQVAHDVHSRNIKEQFPVAPGRAPDQVAFYLKFEGVVHTNNK